MRNKTLRDEILDYLQSIGLDHAQPSYSDWESACTSVGTDLIMAVKGIPCYRDRSPEGLALLHTLDTAVRVSARDLLCRLDIAEGRVESPAPDRSGEWIAHYDDECLDTIRARPTPAEAVEAWIGSSDSDRWKDAHVEAHDGTCPCGATDSCECNCLPEELSVSQLIHADPVMALNADNLLERLYDSAEDVEMDEAWPNTGCDTRDNPTSARILLDRRIRAAIRDYLEAAHGCRTAPWLECGKAVVWVRNGEEWKKRAECAE